MFSQIPINNSSLSCLEKPNLDVVSNSHIYVYLLCMVIPGNYCIQSLYEEVLATEDFLLFKSIMVQKNIDLELQALKLVQHQLGHLPEAYQPSGGGDQKATDRTKRLRRASTEEEIILLKVLEECEMQRLRGDEEPKKITPAKQESLKPTEASAQKAEEQLEETATDLK